MVFSLTGWGLSVAGSAPERRIWASRRASSTEPRPEIWPRSWIAWLSDGAETT